MSNFDKKLPDVCDNICRIYFTCGVDACKLLGMKIMPTNDILTISEAAREIGVTRQRMHKLLETYQVPTEFKGPLKFVKARDLKRIPEIRPTGKKVS